MIGAAVASLLVAVVWVAAGRSLWRLSGRGKGIPRPSLGDSAIDATGALLVAVITLTIRHFLPF